MKKNKGPSLVVIGILTIITIVFWILFSVLRLLESPQEVKVPANILLPLSPALDVETLNQIQTRTFFTEEQINETVLTVPISVPESAEEIPEDQGETTP